MENSEVPAFEEFMRMFQHEFGSRELSSVATENPALIAALRQLHPVKAATTFAGLLTQKSLQSNCLRLEVLVHLALACGEGDKTPAAQFVRTLASVKMRQCFACRVAA
ncbi:MAG: hypothetical protein JJD98_10750 [Polaromonas sp.]|nr:hypothetical protein [Polaromonas sp.]